MQISSIKIISIISIFLLFACNAKEEDNFMRNFLFSSVLNDYFNNVYPEFGEIYDIQTDRYFTTQNTLDHGRISPDLIAISEKFLITGGYNQRMGGQQKDSYLYDFTSNQFTKTGDMVTPRVAHASEKKSDHEILIFGGYTSDLTELPASSIEIFNLDKKEFNFFANMKTPRADHKVLRLNNNTILIFGGLSYPNYVSEIEIFNPATKISSVAGTLTKPRINFTFHKVSDGRIFIIGGFYNELNVFREHIKLVEVLDQTGNVIHSFNLSTNRSRHTSILTNDDKIIVYGGENESGFVETVEIINTTNYSIASTSLNGFPLCSFCQSVLFNTRIIVTGGNTSLGASNKTTQISTIDYTQTGKKNMNVERTMHRASKLNEREMFLIGGSKRKLVP